MSIWFDDEFDDEASNTVLSSHVPSIAGTGWDQIEQSGARDLEVRSGTDDMAVEVSENNDRCTYRILPSGAGAGADQNITVEWDSRSTGSRRSVQAFWHMTGSTLLTDDCWVFFAGPQTLSLHLYTIAGGVPTSRALDTREMAGSGALVEIEVVGNDINVFITGTGFTGREEVFNITSSINNGAGDIGYGKGSIISGSDDMHTADQCVKFQVDGDPPVAGGPISAVHGRLSTLVRM